MHEDGGKNSKVYTIDLVCIYIYGMISIENHKSVTMSFSQKNVSTESTLARFQYFLYWLLSIHFQGFKQLLNDSFKSHAM